MEDNSIIHDPLSYEEQQLQIILMNEVKKRSLQVERQVRERQDIEYQESLLKDMEKEASTKEISIEEISVEEMRQIRLKRFACIKS